MELFKQEGFGFRGETLAARMSPLNFDEFVGQEHIVGKNKPLRRLIEQGRLLSAIFFGPPGTGKTSLAKIIARMTSRPFMAFNAAESTPKALREAVRTAESRRAVLFVDEIHRFNRLQQDLLLPAVERGRFTFLGSTVHNPFFALSKALLSRTLLFEFKPLSESDILKILENALCSERGLASMNLEVEDGVLEAIAKVADGDARRALNYLELLATSVGEGGTITIRLLEETLGVRHFIFDKSGDEHYDMISAFIKSIRGSDPDAAMYWFVRLIEAGEDPRYILRRILVHAAEDIGLADPNALIVAASALTAFEMVGRPEGDLIIAEAVLYLATAPKSNTVLRALAAARKAVKSLPAYEVPSHLRDSHYAGAKKLGRGVGYIYPHGKPHVEQDYLPKELIGIKIFDPRPIGYERVIIERFKEFLKSREAKRNETEVDSRKP